MFDIFKSSEIRKIRQSEKFVISLSEILTQSFQPEKFVYVCSDFGSISEKFVPVFLKLTELLFIKGLLLWRISGPNTTSHQATTAILTASTALNQPQIRFESFIVFYKLYFCLVLSYNLLSFVKSMQIRIIRRIWRPYSKAETIF